MRSPSSLVFLLCGVAAAAPADLRLVSTRDAPPSPPPRIVSVSYSGSGCPSASPGVDRTGGFDDISLRMNDFEASSTSSIADGGNSVNCQAHLSIAGAAAPGWQVGVRDVYVKGHLVLDPGASLDYYVTSFWSEDAGRTTTIKGSLANGGAARLDQDVEARSTVPDGQVAYSPCTAAGGGDVGLLNVNFRVALQAAGAQYGYFGKGPGTTASESWSYVWRRC